MFAGQLLSAIKMVICGRLTESPLQISHKLRQQKLVISSPNCELKVSL